MITRTLKLPIIFAALLLCTSGCERLSAINWPETLACGPGIDDAIGVVSETLLGDAGVTQQLEDLARTHGTDTVVCLVEKLRTDWSAPGAAASPARVSGVARADAFLEEIGTEVQ